MAEKPNTNNKDIQEFKFVWSPQEDWKLHKLKIMTFLAIAGLGFGSGFYRESQKSVAKDSETAFLKARGLSETASIEFFWSALELGIFSDFISQQSRLGATNCSIGGFKVNHLNGQPNLTYVLVKCPDERGRYVEEYQARTLIETYQENEDEEFPFDEAEKLSANANLFWALRL